MSTQSHYRKLHASNGDSAHEPDASLLAAIVESIDDAILSLSLDGLLTTWNHGAERMFGYGADEVLGKRAEFLMTDRMRIAQGVEQLRSGGRTFAIDTNFVRKDGVGIEVSVALSPILDRSANLIGFSAIARDRAEEEKALRTSIDSEHRFERMFQFSTDALSIATLGEGRYVEVNQEFLRMSGYSREQVIGKTALELGFWTDPAEFAGFGVTLLRDGVVRNREMVIKVTDGSSVVVLISSVLVEVDGKHYALGISHDISDLKQLREDLHHSERQLRDVLANAPLAVMAVDRNSIITTVQGRAVNTAGFSPADLVGKSAAELFASDSSIPSHLRRALAGESFTAIDRINGGEFILEIWYSPIWDAKHEVTGAIAVGTDITKRTMAEEELRRSEEYYRSLIEASADVTLVLDEAGTILFAAGQGFKDLGYEISRVIGTHSLDFIHPDYLVEQTKLLTQCFAEPDYISTSEAPIRCADGSWLECEFVEHAGLDLEGKRVLVSTMRNISERKRNELEIAKARDQALAASRAKSEFLSSMSHEIRTPMNAILGMADLLGETELGPEQRRYLEIVTSNGNALLELINGILDLARVESGRLHLESVPFDLVDLTELVADTLGIRAHEKGVELALRFAPDLPTELIGDPQRLRQVLVNLIGNAIKFTERGEVVVNIGPDPAGKGPGDLLVSVTDTGIGIPSDKLPLLFQSFSQADSSVTRKYGGSGLGLAIVDRLVTLMGGKVGVESEPGKGSTFYFTANFGLQDGPAPLPPMPELDLKGVRVLVVDDNQVNRTIVREMLAPRGASVTEADSGGEGIRLIKQGRESGYPFRLLLIDYQMPEMDGIEMIRRIRNDFPAPDLAIMMLSSTGLPEAVAKLRQLGADWYIVKPIKRRQLYAAIAAALGISRSPAAARLQTRAAAPVPALRSPDRPQRILLVDDSPDNRLLIHSYLRKTPYLLDEAENGQIAVNKVTTSNYDLVLMDIQMPVMDGYAAVKEIRQWEIAQKRDRIPIIALTASALYEAVHRTVEAGFDLHVSKPIARDTLLNVIAQAIAGRHGSREQQPQPAPAPA